MRISFDPGEVYARQGLARLTPLLSRCDILFITEKELGDPDRKALKGIHFHYPSHRHKNNRYQEKRGRGPNS